MISVLDYCCKTRKLLRARIIIGQVEVVTLKVYHIYVLFVVNTHRVYNKSNTTDATRGAGTGDPSGAHVVSYRSLLVLLSFFLLVMLYFLWVFFSWSCCISCVFFSLGHVVFPVSFFSLGHVVFPVHIRFTVSGHTFSLFS